MRKSCQIPYLKTCHKAKRVDVTQDEREREREIELSVCIMIEASKSDKVTKEKGVRVLAFLQDDL